MQIRNKMTYQKGHPSYRPIVKGIRIVTWSCSNCGVETSKTEKELGYRSEVPKFCSKECRYAVGPRTGMITPLETRKKLSEQKLGSKNPSWRGGVTHMRVRLRNTLEYKMWRTEVFKNDDYTCRRCGQRGGKLEADHIVPFMLKKEDLLNVQNGQTLCKACHRLKSNDELRKHWKNQYSI